MTKLDIPSIKPSESKDEGEVVDCCRASSYVRDIAGAVALLRTEVRRANPPLKLLNKLSWEIGFGGFGGKRLGSEKGFRVSDLLPDKTDVGLKLAVFKILFSFFHLFSLSSIGTLTSLLTYCE